jgi:alcohol dehydrogenase class IV
MDSRPDELREMVAREVILLKGRILLERGVKRGGAGVISPFEYYMSTRMLFGPGAARQAGSEARRLGASRVMLVADPGVERAGLVTRVLESLHAADLEVRVFNDVESNPRDVTVDRLAQRVLTERCEALVAVGGGSTIDSAKGAGTVVADGGGIRDYEGGGVTMPIHPVVAIPTTAGTGAEVTGYISVTHTGKHYKMTAGCSPLCLPRVALLDPEMLAGLPAGMAAASGMDALSHAVEGYLSPRATALTDMMALRAIELIAGSLEEFVSDRCDLGPASDMLLGSTLAGIVISVGCGIGHALARALGGRFDLHHGLACGVLLAHHMRFNLPVREAKLADIARAMGARKETLSAAEAAERGIEVVRDLCRRIGLPGNLRNLKATEADIQAVARVGLGNSAGDPREATLEDVTAIFREIL